MIEFDQQAGAPHALDIIVGRDDDIVARIAAADFGEQFVVVAEKIQIDIDAGRGFEIGERVFADISVPIVEVEFRLFRRRRARRQRKRRRRAAERLQKSAPRPTAGARSVALVFHRFRLLCSFFSVATIAATIAPDISKKTPRPQMFARIPAWPQTTAALRP